MYLINPFGRLVATDNSKEYNELISKGFKVPDGEAISKHVQEKTAIAQMMTKAVGENDVYFATVSQGGKDGYSVASKNIMKELNSLGVSCSIIKENQKIAILFHNPYSVNRLDNPYRIIYTMFESTKIPDDWLPYLEEADLVLVPSQWCADVFARSGIKTRVVPLGYDDESFVYKPRKNKAEAHEVFNFLHFNAFNIRKGFLEVFKAFVKEFDTSEPVRMIFKTTLETPPIPINKSIYPNIEVISGKIETRELVDLCHASDCFVFPSRGEGFGMTPLEAMGTGLPAIIPNAHGITEYFDSSCMYEVEVGSTCPGVYSKYKGIDVGEMVICDIDDLAKKMRWVYEHQDECLDMGKRASDYVEKWTYKNTAEKLKEIIDEVLSKPMPKRKVRDTLALELV